MQPRSLTSKDKLSIWGDLCVALGKRPGESLYAAARRQAAAGGPLESAARATVLALRLGSLGAWERLAGAQALATRVRVDMASGTPAQDSKGGRGVAYRVTGVSDGE